MDMCITQLSADFQHWQDSNVKREDRIGAITLKMIGPSNGYSFEDCG